MKYSLLTCPRLATTQPSLRLPSVNLARRCFPRSFPTSSSFPLFCLVFPWQDKHGERKANSPVGHPLHSSSSLTTALTAWERREVLQNLLSHPQHTDWREVFPSCRNANKSSTTKQQVDSQNVTETAAVFSLPRFLSFHHLPQRLERHLSPSYQVGGFL